MGASMLPALEGFTGWIREHWPLIEDARRTFDEARSQARLHDRHAPM
jgi:hypothetical protein